MTDLRLRYGGMCSQQKNWCCWIGRVTRLSCSTCKLYPELLTVEINGNAIKDVDYSRKLYDWSKQTKIIWRWICMWNAIEWLSWTKIKCPTYPWCFLFLFLFRKRVKTKCFKARMICGNFCGSLPMIRQMQRINAYLILKFSFWKNKFTILLMWADSREMASNVNTYNYHKRFDSLTLLLYVLI